MIDESQDKRPLLVLGVGNILLQDEGLGVHAVRILQEDSTIPAEVDIVDGGTTGMALMSMLQQYKHVIIIDATADNNPPGTVRHISPSTKVWLPPTRTIHELGLNDLILAMNLDGYCPKIDMIVVSANRYTTIGFSLSPEVEASMPVVIDLSKHLISKYLK